MYLQAKGNPNQLCFLLQKMPGSGENYDSFQAFLDENQYTRSGILRYERIFGPTYVSTGGAKTTEEFCRELNLKVLHLPFTLLRFIFSLILLGWGNGAGCRLRDWRIGVPHGGHLRRGRTRGGSVDEYDFYRFGESGPPTDGCQDQGASLFSSSSFGLDRLV